MIFDSDRLLYRKFEETELDLFSSWYRDAAIMKYVFGRPFTDEECKTRFEKAMKVNAQGAYYGFFACFQKSDDRFVGIAKYELLESSVAEVGYGFFEEFWGRGYASEMLVWMMDLSKKTSEVKTLVGIVNPQNSASIRVLTKQGFHFDRHGDGEDKNSDFYSYQL